MVSTNNPWHLLHEQLTQIEDTMIPSAPYRKDEKLNENHWIEFDTNILIGEKIGGCLISIEEINHSIVITNVRNNDGLLHQFDTILSFNDINFLNLKKKAAEYIINAHQDKQIKIRIRRLQPTILETIELNLQENKIFNSHKLGFTIDGGIGKINPNDPGLFVIGIKTRSRVARNGRLRIGDRLMQISNKYSTINLQCMQLDMALKLIRRMKSESTSVTITVAHPIRN